MPYARTILAVSLVFLAIAMTYAFVSFGDGRPKRVPVSGIVLIDDKPMTGGMVRVFPQGNREASGPIGSDGRFTLSTFEPSDGCMLGKHPAAVNGLHVINGGLQERLAPKNYADPNKSGLTVEISGPTDDLKINLTWAGGKPFFENTSGQVVDPKEPKKREPTNANQL